MRLLLITFLFFTQNVIASNLSNYQIAFSSQRNGYFEIYRIDADGNNLVQLTDLKTDMPDYDPRWVDNASQLAVQSYRRGGWRTWIMDDAGKSLQRFNQYNSYEGKASWSTGTNEVVFTSYRPAFNLFVADKKGRILRQLTSLKGYKVQVDQAHWSPDGKKLVYISNQGGSFNIYQMDAYGKDIKRLTNHAANDYQPSFSPDGKTILFTSDRDGNFETYVMNIDGSNQKRLTNNSKTNSSKYQKQDTANISSPYLVPATWSPDGLWIAYFCLYDNDAEICIMKADGSEKTRLTTSRGHDGMPGWRFKP